jgi:hypothetical protein
MFPFSHKFQSILNVTTDTDDLKNKLNSIPKTQQMISYLSIILQYTWFGNL